ncbi:MAG: hypothetical protein KAU95_01275, partial [Candidatus Aenigmarchaeota archaeon]|nr:hypothetical protein [Candidatus Aenigmarchaeota archaeon]
MDKKNVFWAKSIVAIFMLSFIFMITPAYADQACNATEDCPSGYVCENGYCSITCSIEVHVRDLDDESIGKALVKVGREKQLMTSDSGVVVFENLEPADYEVSAKKLSYHRDSTWIKCKGGKETVYLYLKAKTGNLKVHVSDCSTGYPITSAVVNVINGVEKISGTTEFDFAYFGDIPARKYEVSAIADGYVSNHKNAYVYESENNDRLTEVDMCLNKDKRVDKPDIEINKMKIEPSIICKDKNQIVDISLSILLENREDLEVEVKFYIEDYGWDYIGKEKRTLDEDETEEFTIGYEYNKNRLDAGTYKIKAKIDYGNEEETKYGYLTVKDCSEEREDFEIDALTLNPDEPRIGGMIIVTVPVDLTRKGDDSESITMEARIDGVLQKSQTLGFYSVGQTKTFEFAFDTDDYGVGHHTIKITGKGEHKTKEVGREFYIYGEDYKNKYCLRINDISVDKSPLKTGDNTKIKVEIENCGDSMERNIKVKLEGSDMMFTKPFNLMSGREKEVEFEFDVLESENLTISVWNGYNAITETYNLKVYSGKLSTHFKQEYVVYGYEDNIIQFEVRNTGKVKDVFELSVSEEVAEWVTGLPDRVELEPGESKDIEICVYPDANTDTFEFELFSKTAGSETSAKSKFKVSESWSLPTGQFVSITSALPWFLVLILLSVLVGPHAVKKYSDWNANRTIASKEEVVDLEEDSVAEEEGSPVEEKIEEEGSSEKKE